MSTATLPAVHTFTASAEDRRRCTCGKSRNTSVHGYDKAARAAAKAAPAVTEEPAAEVTAEAPAAVEESPSDARSDRAGELAAAVTAGELSFDEAAAALLTEHPVIAAPEPRRALPVQEVTEEPAAPRGNRHALCGAPALGSAPEHRCPECKALTPAAEKPARGRKVEPNTRALWVARELVAIILDSTDPAHAVIVRKLSAVIPNNRGGRTIRLTEAEAELLSGIATEIETAALDETVDVDGRGRLARSCDKMRDRLAALWA